MTAAELITSALKITFIDIILSGDNAVVIAMAARSLPKEQQRKAIAWGGGAAIGLRVVITALVAYALAIPLLQLGGGILLFLIACKLLKGGGAEEHKELKAGSTLGSAVMTIVLADFVMSLDNMLAVGGASHGSMPLLLLGLAISMGIIMFASGFIANWMNKYNWLIYAGAAILAWTAGDMILNDRWLHRVFVPGPILEYAVPGLLAAAAIGFGLLVNRRGNDSEAA